MQLAGLLTYSRSSCLPIYVLNSDLDWKTVKELTAAGQLRTYTVFPFNLNCDSYNQEPKALQKYQKISLEQILLS
jgi:outer membrane receptor for ferrienterochelin and colicin